MAFKFKLTDGTEHEFPNFSECGIGVILKTRDIKDEEEKILTMLQLAFGGNEEHEEALAKVPIGKFGEFSKKFTAGLSVKK